MLRLLLGLGGRLGQIQAPLPEPPSPPYEVHHTFLLFMTKQKRWASTTCVEYLQLVCRAVLQFKAAWANLELQLGRRNSRVQPPPSEPPAPHCQINNPPLVHNTNPRTLRELDMHCRGLQHFGAGEGKKVESSLVIVGTCLLTFLLHPTH